ncbi:M32 carboxypeptidase Taq metallopeptidase peptidase [Pelomyxa schiedti]|nr:M32 carboxypeptidase Taq metallopeptidase peptidase [Pelomyxa schiedti]
MAQGDMAPEWVMYDELSRVVSDICNIGSVSDLLEWDSQVMMPSGATDSRASQRALLERIKHEKSTSAELGTLINTLLKSDLSRLTPFEAANVRDAKRNYDIETKVPVNLAASMAVLEVKGYDVWVKAREQNDFSIFWPTLNEWVQLQRQRAKFVAPGVPTYDTCLDKFERGLTSARVAEVLGVVKEELFPLIKAIAAKNTQPESAFIEKGFPTEGQLAVSKRVATDMGFNWNCGRLDVSVHPFTSEIHPTDVRITTKFLDDLADALTSTVHEAGHGLYSQGLPRGSQYSAKPLSMAMHESQSLFWERFVCKSPEFWQHYWPLVLETFPHVPREKTARDAYAAINVVKPSFIRISADEVTYHAHIIVRCEMEELLLNGTGQIPDADTLRNLWNTKMQHYLGITPSTDKEGILQDVHWSCGLFGYFPTYTMGAMCAAQLFQAVVKEIPDIPQQMAAGKFDVLLGWLRQHIHSKGSLYSSLDDHLLHEIGAILDPHALTAHLKAKYSALYSL